MLIEMLLRICNVTDPVVRRTWSVETSNAEVSQAKLSMTDPLTRFFEFGWNPFLANIAFLQIHILTSNAFLTEVFVNLA